MRGFLCLKNSRLRFLQVVFFRCVLRLNDTSYRKMSEGTNRNMPAMNTLVQLLAVYTDPYTINARRNRQTDG